MRLKYRKYSLSQGVQMVKTRTAVMLSAVAIAMSGGTGLSLAMFGSAHAATPNWNLNGSYVLDFEYLGGHYLHDATVSGQDSAGNFVISGGNPSGGAHTYVWSGTGSISGDAVTIDVDYSASPDALGTHMNMVGTVASNGTLSGTWHDNYQDGDRNGAWTTSNGHANHLASQVVVTPANVQGWSSADTRPGGSVTYVADATAPGTPHTGALSLKTDSSTTSKAQYLHETSTALGDVLELSYSTKQNSASFLSGDASFQLPVCLDGTTGGTCSGFTTLVYEPYQNGTVTNGVWQNWDVDAGQMWSSRNYTDGATCTVVAGGGGAPFYTLAALKTACPNAVVAGFGVNIGSNNPSYDVETDLVNFNGTTYNFEPAAPPVTPVTLTSKDDCKNDGWKASTNPTFKNQGDCVSYFATKGKNGGNGAPAPAVLHFAYGSVTLSGPTQELNFALNDNGASATDTGTAIYSNPGAGLTYAANVTCVNVSGNTAYFTYQIPSTAPVAANVWVVWKVVDNATDTAGFTTAADMASANAVCEAGSAGVTNYSVVFGDIKVQ